MDNKIKRKIEQLQRKGLMLGEIADELGVSENLVKEDLLTMGIKPDISARVNFQNIEVDIDGVHKQKEEVLLKIYIITKDLVKKKYQKLLVLQLKQ